MIIWKLAAMSLILMLLVLVLVLGMPAQQRVCVGEYGSVRYPKVRAASQAGRSVSICGHVVVEGHQIRRCPRGRSIAGVRVVGWGVRYSVRGV